MISYSFFHGFVHILCIYSSSLLERGSMSSGVGERQSIALPWAEGCFHLPVPARMARERMREGMAKGRMREVLAQQGWARLKR